MVTIPHGSYFEGVLQLRNPTDELQQYVVDTVERDDRAAITKIKNVQGGFDYYLTSQKYLQILGKKIKARFSGEFKLTSTLHTQRKDGKKLYRITILFRQYDFAIGDTVIVEGEEHEVLRIENNQVQVKELRSGKKVRVVPDRVSVIR